MKALHTVLLLILFSFVSFGEKNNPGTSKIVPSNHSGNVKINAVNSSILSFISNAVNTDDYHSDLADGTGSKANAPGITTHKDNHSDIHTLRVATKSSGRKSLSKSIDEPVTDKRKLVWSEEFNTDGLPDSTKWGYDLGGSGWGNNELEFYTNRAENAYVSGGTLKINAKKENHNGKSYTSARLLSKGKYSFKYGRIEARAKLPAGTGTWPAIWMLGNNIKTAGWPACGEMDVMEHIGRSMNKIFGTLHYPGHSGSNGSGGTTNIPTATTEFHKYAMEWSETSISFLVDDVPFYTIENNNSMPFNQNFFIILNLAMGGNFGGPVDPAFTRATMEIDYIRVYQ